MVRSRRIENGCGSGKYEVAGQVRSLHALSEEPVLVQLLIERHAADAKLRRGTHAIVAVFAESFDDPQHFEVFGSLGKRQIGHSPVWDGPPATPQGLRVVRRIEPHKANVFREVNRLNNRSRRQRYGTLDRIAKFANVARPMISLQQG